MERSGVWQSPHDPVIANEVWQSPHDPVIANEVWQSPRYEDIKFLSR